MRQRSSRTRWDTTQICYKAAEPFGGLDAELAIQELSVRRVLAKRLGGVSFSDMDPDEGGMRTLPERFGPHGRQSSSRRIAVLPAIEERPREGLQSMEAKLPPVLGLDEHPIVVPVRQELLREDRDRVFIGQRRRRRPITPEESASQTPSVPKIDRHLVRELDLLSGDLHGSSSGPVQVGEGGSKTGRCVGLGGCRPQRARHDRPPDRPGLQREERHEALRSLRQDDDRAGVLQPEAVEQGDPELRTFPGADTPTLGFELFELVQGSPFDQP